MSKNSQHERASKVKVGGNLSAAMAMASLGMDLFPTPHRVSEPAKENRNKKFRDKRKKKKSIKASRRKNR